MAMMLRRDLDSSDFLQVSDIPRSYLLSLALDLMSIVGYFWNSEKQSSNLASDSFVFTMN